MKKYGKRIFSLILTAVMMFGMAISGYAAGVVTIKANGEEYEFTPGITAGYSGTDLFGSEFKNLMPGDKIDSYTVRIHNEGRSGYTTKVYIRALGPNDKIVDGSDLGDKKVNQAMLGYLNLTVKKAKGDTELFNATADKTDKMTDWVLLGSLKKGGEVDLTLSLYVDPIMGSDPELTAEENKDMQRAASAIDWEFKIEEIKNPGSSDTGDNTGIMLYGAMFGVAALALFAIVVLKKRTKEE